MRKIFYALALFISTNVHAAWQVCNMFETVATSSTSATRVLMYYSKQEKDYVSGGVTLTYPAGTYPGTPNVNVSLILKNATYSNTESYVPIITANSGTSITIRVNKVVGGVSTEAATDDVTVHLHAIGSAQ